MGFGSLRSYKKMTRLYFTVNVYNSNEILHIFGLLCILFSDKNYFVVHVNKKFEQYNYSISEVQLKTMMTFGTAL